MMRPDPDDLPGARPTERARHLGQQSLRIVENASDVLTRAKKLLDDISRAEHRHWQQDT
ncbi:hypothetical protein [uncultured Roseobacter sp.]|uniref:hypothetical protein n=1 Tax=uncultured Roseobacter sp. TaxID=114847 RepID=UPI002639072D|nr:hypothetical protein [uncultured Roseobacter sp.]